MSGLELGKHFYIYVVPLVIVESIIFAYAFDSDLRTRQVMLGLLGLWWCLAALWVEIRIMRVYPGMDMEKPWETYPTAYKPFCDFAPWANCSQVLMSPPGRFLRYFGIAKEHATSDGVIEQARAMIDVPNPTLGVLFFACHLFYPVLLIIPVLNIILPWLFFGACCFVGLMTIWLAYNLAFVLKDFCVVCVSMYVANFALIPMMYNICLQNKTNMSDFVFFGGVPSSILYPFLVIDAIMGAIVGILALEYFGFLDRGSEFCGLLPSHKIFRECGPSHKVEARECEPDGLNDYKPMPECA